MCMFPEPADIKLVQELIRDIKKVYSNLELINGIQTYPEKRNDLIKSEIEDLQRFADNCLRRLKHLENT